MQSIYSIYKATNIITGKSYIGFDSNWPKRQKDHKRESQKLSNLKFYNSIRKYGWDNFTWEIIYQSYDGKHTLNVMEPHFIQENNSLNDGYNMTLGGNRGPVLKGDLNGMFGKTHTKEVCEKLSKKAKDHFKGKTYEQLYGKEKSDELKKIRSDNTKGKNNSGKNNPRYDNNIYTFKNKITNEIYIGDRFSFYNKYNLKKVGVCTMIKHKKVYMNWVVVF